MRSSDGVPSCAAEAVRTGHGKGGGGKPTLARADAFQRLNRRDSIRKVSITWAVARCGISGCRERGAGRITINTIQLPIRKEVSRNASVAQERLTFAKRQFINMADGQKVSLIEVRRPILAAQIQIVRETRLVA